jgi:hypothetical protein
MKTLNPIILLLMIFTIFLSCKKDESPDPVPTPDNYSSISQFHSVNGVPLQTFTIDGTTGGEFSTPLETKVKVPSNAFLNKEGNPVTGTVTIEFKDIYKRSDMLLSDRSTNSINGIPIKSGGMFFIKATQNNAAVSLAAGKKITIEQPLKEWPLDTAMKAMIMAQNPEIAGWVVTPDDTVNYSLTSYIFSLYQFNAPVDSGSWCNSDNPTYFSGYTLTRLTVHPLDNYGDYNTEMFLVFKNVNSMVHVYYNPYNTPPAFLYPFAPLGLECTAVAIGVKDGKLYSSFTPFTITPDLTVDFSLTETTTDAFKAQLNSLQ